MNKNEQEQYLIELRRSQVYELHAKGYSNTEISHMLSEHVSEPTVSRDLTFLRRQAKEKIRNFIDEDLPNEYNKTLVGLNAILREAWTTAQNATGRDKIQALELAQKAYQMRLELLGSATVVESAVKFVEDIKRKKGQLQPDNIAGSEEDREDFQNDEEPTPVEPEEDLGEI